MYSLICLKFFFSKINKTDIKIGTNKEVFTLNIGKKYVFSYKFKCT